MKDERKDWLFGELNKAYHRARLGKTKTPQVVEFDKVAKTELAVLARGIHARSYAPRPSTASDAPRMIQASVNTTPTRNTGGAVAYSAVLAGEGLATPAAATAIETAATE